MALAPPPVQLHRHPVSVETEPEPKSRFHSIASLERAASRLPGEPVLASHRRSNGFRVASGRLNLHSRWEKTKWSVLL
ncbi:hypothetical protein AGIG_G157 [Arapaima gigas]